MWEHSVERLYTEQSKCLASQRAWAGLASPMGPYLGHSRYGGLKRKLLLSPEAKHTQEGAEDSADSVMSGTFSPAFPPLLLLPCLLTDRGMRAEVGAAEKPNLARRCQDGPQDPRSIYANSCGHPPGTWKCRKGLCGKPGPCQGGARTLLVIPTLVLSPGQNDGFQDSSTKPHPILTQKHFS